MAVNANLLIEVQRERKHECSVFTRSLRGVLCKPAREQYRLREVLGFAFLVLEAF